MLNNLVICTAYTHIINYSWAEAFKGLSETCFEKLSKKTRNNEYNPNVFFIVHNKHLTFSNIWSALASQWARFLHKMVLSDSVALMT